MHMIKRHTGKKMTVIFLFLLLRLKRSIIFNKIFSIKTSNLKSLDPGTSLVAQWLRIRLPMQGTQVRALVREDPTCRGATNKPVRHNY